MSNIDGVRLRVVSERRAVDRLTGEAKEVARRGLDVKNHIEVLTRSLQAHEEAIKILQSYSESRQAELQTKMENLVTYGLRSIFGGDLTFAIVRANRGNLAAMDFVIRSSSSDGVIETSVMDSRGGGVAAVAGFILRLVFLLLSKSKADPVLLLDESFAQLSEDYEPALASFLRELVDRTAAQVLLVTHSDSYSEYADVVYRTSIKDGKTTATRVT